MISIRATGTARSIPMKLYADAGRQGAKIQSAPKTIVERVNVEIVNRSDRARRFLV
jgi:hypothetical protein